MEHKISELKYTYNDISIVPVTISPISSRSECNPYYGSDRLPLFTAPMSSVVGVENMFLFEEAGISTILPRTIMLTTRLHFADKFFVAVSLKEFESLIDNHFKADQTYYICIDIANGHMGALHYAIRLAKSKFPKLIIMSGNVASAEGYEALSLAGCDYIRVGIGGGHACITSSNTGIHYPLASLIRECYIKSAKYAVRAKIIADGGIRGYADIIKALALGADYVMCGTLFNRMLESAGDTKVADTIRIRYGSLAKDIKVNNPVDQYDENSIKLFKQGDLPCVKTFYGMSTKRAQTEMGNESLKTSEGIELTQNVEYTMGQWVENFEHYMRTVMSYVGERDLINFVGLPDERIIRMTQESINVINK